MCVCMCMCLHTCVCLRVCGCMCMCACVWVCACACTRVCACVCVCVYGWVCACMGVILIMVSTSTHYPNSHMQLLVNHYTLPKALVVMANLLKNIQYQIFTHIAEDNSIRGIGATKLLDEHLEAINFGVHVLTFAWVTAFTGLLHCSVTALQSCWTN